MTIKDSIPLVLIMIVLVCLYIFLIHRCILEESSEWNKMDLDRFNQSLWEPSAFD
jgi:hypothetical protein